MTKNILSFEGTGFKD